MRRRSAVIVGLAAVLGGGAIGCTKGADTPSAPVRVENPSLGIAVANLPEAARVVANEGERLEIELGQEGGVAASCTTEVGDEQRGVNLVEEVRAQKALFESLEAGEMVGTTELGTPLGPAYLARGRYQEGGQRLEELRVLTLHPSGNRVLTLRCVYPQGDDADSKLRFGAVVGLLGEIEGAGAANPG